ncbi:MAG: dihydrodipicolinate synthase family protein [Anaerolineaceae bacterium]|nr:dihydrodipicolinate synthase family protein [Anaerolineaceae bacterium]
MKKIQALIANIRPNRKIEGISAVLLPFTEQAEVDLVGFEKHVERVYAAGLTPAVNMDTGYVNLLSVEERYKILALTARISAGRKFVAGVYVEGQPDDLTLAYQAGVDQVASAGGLPILFQSNGMKQLSPDALIVLFERCAKSCGALLAFELGEMFADFGQIYSLPIVSELMKIPEILGLKHSSLRRDLEWERIQLRDQQRPDFRIYTGNDLAIDMVMYGSDYLLGLSTFAPDYFAKRDAYWLSGDARFYELNDVLQYLGNFAFRHPVSSYKHSAAQFLKLRGWIKTDKPHPLAVARPDSDIVILEQILKRLESL